MWHKQVCDFGQVVSPLWAILSSTKNEWIGLCSIISYFCAYPHLLSSSEFQHIIQNSLGIINQLSITDICKTFYSMTAAYISHVQQTFTKTD